MVKVFFALGFGVAIVAWLLGLFAALSMLQFRKPEVPKSWFLWNGYAFFTGRNFTPSAEAPRRLFVLCAAAFFIAVLTIIAFGLVGWESPPPPA
jgi:hypothetical protein